MLVGAVDNFVHVQIRNTIVGVMFIYGNELADQFNLPSTENRCRQRNKNLDNACQVSVERKRNAAGLCGRMSNNRPRDRRARIAYKAMLQPEY